MKVKSTARRTVQYPKVIIEIKPSKRLLGQIGIFAVAHLACGQIIAPAAVYQEVIPLSRKQIARLDPVTKRRLHAMCPGLADGSVLAPPNLNYLPIPWYLNHSCTKHNTAFTSKGDLITTRAIKKSEELLLDYSAIEANPQFKLKCRCGEVGCRKIVRANPSLVRQSK